MKGRQKKLLMFLRHTMLWLNIAVAAVCLLAAYQGYMRPSSCGIIAVLGLAFPIMLLLTIGFLLFWLAVCRKMMLVSAVALVLTIPQQWALCPLNFDDDDEDADIRLMSYNIYGAHRSDSDFSQVDEIIHSNADVVCLQESPVSIKAFAYNQGQEKTDSLCGMYPYSVFDEKIYLAVLSKYPVELIEKFEDNKYFCYAVYSIMIDDRQLLVFNMHLESIGLTGHDKELYMNLTSPSTNDRSLRGVRSQLIGKLTKAFKNRELQADTISGRIAALRVKYPKASVVVCGDFNDTPYSYSYLTIKGALNDAYSDGGFGPVITYNRNRFYFHIDHIFSDDAMEAVRCFCGTTRASDHYALIADFKFR